MPNDVKKFWIGIAILAVSIYAGLDPNGVLGSMPFLRAIAGGVFLSTIVFFLLESGLKIGLSNAGDASDRVFGVVFVGLSILIGGGFGWAAYATNRSDLVVPILVGLVVYAGLIRGPVVRLFKA
jgi:hypothetical protein